MFGTNSLRQNLTVLPAPSEREPLAQPETLQFDQIADCLRADEKVTIAGFGRFEMRPRKPKAYTNPKTKVSSQLESTSIPGFKASGRFKQKLEACKKSVEETA